MEVERTTKIIEKDVVYMEEPTAMFVSLVQHGANGEPFYVVKSADGDERVIQRVLISKKVPEKEADELLKRFSTKDEKDYGEYLAYDQVKKEDCEEESFDGIYLDEEKKLFAVTAKKKEDVAKATKPRKSQKDSKEVVKAAVPYEVGGRIWDEMMAMENLVSGACRQSEAEEGWRKETSLIAVKNLQTFLTMLFDSFGEDGVAKAVQKMPDKPRTEEQEVKMEGLFATKEEMKAFIVQVIGEIEEAKKQSDAAKVAEDEKKKEKDALTGEIKKLNETIVAVKSVTDGLDTRLKAIETETPAPAAGREKESVAKTVVPPVEPEKKEVFKGLIFQRTAIAS
jgi:hypothetical protein